MDDAEILDLISDAIGFESWFEGKTLTVMVPDDYGVPVFAKLRLVSIRETPSPADLKGEPE